METKFSIFLLFFLFISCNNNAPVYNPPETIKFFPLKVGNYWVYEFNEIDGNFNIVPGTESIDSFVVISKQTVLDKIAYPILRYKNNKPIDTLYLSKEGSKLFRLYSGATDSIRDIGLTWFKIGDLDVNDWNIFANISSDSNYVFENNKVIVSLHITINGTRLSLEKVLFPKETLMLLPIILKDDRKTFFDYYFNDDTVKSNIEIITQKNERLWFQQNIGIYMWQFDPYNILTRSDSTNKYNPSRIERFNGWKRQLIRYKAEE